jgi:hypothetical protein
MVLHLLSVPLQRRCTAELLRDHFIPQAIKQFRGQLPLLGNAGVVRISAR